ncbi:MAG: carboxypeptidase regulatory-like domain-containing protein [bacterium]|nr:carboxypeptidase regulatory-like domain-containing protein [bacterium]
MRMRNLVLGLVMLLALGDSCSNNVVGVQDYGSVTGRILDATTNRPIANALVSVGSLYTGSADPQGAFTLQNIPIGRQIVTARMPGYTTDSHQILVRKDRVAAAGYLRLVPLTVPPGTPTLAPPATPTPAATEVPTWSPPGTTATPSPTPMPTASPTLSATASPTP